jgi:hypothetical protein
MNGQTHKGQTLRTVSEIFVAGMSATATQHLIAIRRSPKNSCWPPSCPNRPRLPLRRTGAGPKAAWQDDIDKRSRMLQ